MNRIIENIESLIIIETISISLEKLLSIEKEVVREKISWNFHKYMVAENLNSLEYKVYLLRYLYDLMVFINTKSKANRKKFLDISFELINKIRRI